MRDEDYFILQKLRANVEKTYPRDDDNIIDNDVNKDINSYYNKDSIIIQETENYIKKIINFSNEIDDPELTPALKEMIGILDEMVSYCRINKEGEKKIEKINEYHLPTAIKMLNSYIDFCNFPVKNENIQKTSQDIEDVIIKLNKALKNILVEMNQNRLIDINSDIDVLKNILEKEGL